MLLRLILVALFLIGPALGAQVSQAEYAERRARLFERLPDGVTLVGGAPEAELDYMPWQQARPLLYLTGFNEPDASLLLLKFGSDRRALLFVREKDPAREVWTGRRLGVAAVRTALGMEGREAGTLKMVLDSLREAHFDAKPANADSLIGIMRGRKSEAELARLRIAAEISARGHVAVMRAIAPEVGEFQLQALAEYTWRSEGADGPGYGSIVGSGPNSTTLHYNRNDRIARAGEVVVMDMAAQFDGYSADITRTVPVSGRFSPEQREIYALVLAAQKAAERQVRAGASSRAMSDSANAVLRVGLARLGLIEGPDARYDCGTERQPRQCTQLSLYYMHGLGHGIGLDVHDPDQYYTTGRIEVGSAFTIEPGVYVRTNLLEIIPETPANRAMKARIATAVGRYAGIGVRIEDDYLVTGPGADGVLRPSAGVPREMDEIEAELAKPRPAPLPIRRAP